MRHSVPTWVTTWLALLVSGGSVRAEAARRPTFDIAADEKFVWSCYMICFPISRDYTRLSYDRPLDRPRDGEHPRLVDLRNAVAAGFDALSLDLFIADKHALPAFRQLVDLVNKHNVPIGLTPMFDGFGRPGVTEDQVVEKVAAWFKQFGREACVVRCGGRPVISTYGTASLAPAAWSRIFARLRDAGCEGYWVFEGGAPLSLGPKPNVEAVAAWLDLFPAAYAFLPGMTADRLRVNAEEFRTRFRATGKRWVGSTMIGYWRPEVAVYTSPGGTARLRGQWDALRQADVRWVQQNTWNDLSENHHVMPSENYGTTFVELSRYLVRTWKDMPPDLPGPRVFLGRMRELQIGEDAHHEVLMLLRPEDAPAAVSLELADATGRTLAALGPRALTRPGLQVADFSVPVRAMPAGRLLVPKAIVRTNSSREPIVIEGEPSVVSPGGFYPERCFSWIYSAAPRRPTGVELRFTLDGRAPGATLAPKDAKGAAAWEVRSPSTLADVVVLHSGLQVFSTRCREPKRALGTSVRHAARLDLNRRGQLPPGFYTLQATTRDGRVAATRPVFIEPPTGRDGLVAFWPFDDGDGPKVLDASPWLRDGRLGGRPQYEAWRPTRTPDPWGGRCLTFDGVDDRVLAEGPVVPPDGYTVECWIKPETLGWRGKAAPSAIFGTANATVYLTLDPKGRLALTRKSPDAWRQTTGSTPLEVGRWRHVAATFDGTTLRLFQDGRETGRVAAPGKVGRVARFALGHNTVTNGAYFHGSIDELRVWREPLSPDRFGPHHPAGGVPQTQGNKS